MDLHGLLQGRVGLKEGPRRALGVRDPIPQEGAVGQARGALGVGRSLDLLG